MNYRMKYEMDMNHTWRWLYYMMLFSYVASHREQGSTHVHSMPWSCNEGVGGGAVVWLVGHAERVIMLQFPTMSYLTLLSFHRRSSKSPVNPR